MTLKEQGKQLYKTAFPSDPNGFINDFFDRFFQKSCRFILKDGKIASMLFLLPCELKIKEKSYPAAYLYAAATLPEYRGQGLMSELIEQAKLETVEKGTALITKPASESLYGYYAKFGFKTAFYSTACDLHDLPDNQKSLTIDEYIAKREELLKDIPHIILKDMSFALSGLKLIGNTDFCAAVELDGDKVRVKEYLHRNNFVETAKTPFAMLIKPENISLAEKLYFGIAMD